MKRLARTSIFFYSVLWLMFLLVAGTLAQRELGLYQAQQLYFSSFIYWLGPVPLPGGYTTLAVIFVNLLARLLFTTKWIWPRLGTIITHGGALLLLLGAGLTAAFSTEGAMVLAEGEQSAVVSDYHEVEVALTRVSNEQVVAQFHEDAIDSGAQLQAAGLPVVIEVLEFFPNIRPEPRLNTPSDDHRGFNKLFKLIEVPRAKQSEDNHAGMVFRVRGADAGEDGVYAIFDRMMIKQSLTIGGEEYRIELRHAQRILPFRIELIDFEQEMYPGTTKARGYRSVVNVHDGELVQRSIIQMNEPLRYGGYTFYQASFIEGGAGETSVLAVVKNAGRLFPYISSIIMCVGLLIHLLLQVPLRMRGQQS